MKINQVLKYLSIFVVFAFILVLVACGDTKIEIKLAKAMKVGESQELIATVDGETGEELVWSSSDESILKIEDGKAVAVGVGEVTVKATFGKATADIKVTVETNEVELSYELNGGTVSETLPAKRTLNEEVVLPTPTKEGFEFAGWYSNSDFSGNKITKLDSSNNDVTKLYAKWSEIQYKVVYHLYGESDAAETKEEQISDFSNVKLYEPSYESYNVFSGWYSSEGFIYEIKEIKKENFVNGKLDLYGRIMSKGKSFKVNYVFNGGSTQYSSRSEMLADFLADYNAVLGKSHKTIKLIGTSATAPLTFHTFYQGQLADGTKMSEKWGWLPKYVLDLSKKSLPSNNYNVLALSALINNSLDATNTNYTTAVSCSFRAFLNGMSLGTGRAQTVDFGIEKYQNGFWDYLGQSEQYSEKAGGYNIALPELKKENYEFLGWYRDESLTEGQVVSIYNDITLYAKFGENKPVEKIVLNTVPDGLVKYTDYQIEYTVSPADANIKTVEFVSSDPSIASIDAYGVIYGASVGTVTVKVISDSLSKAFSEFELKVYTPNYFDVSYETNSYVLEGDKIKLNANYLSKDVTPKLKWTSKDSSIATVENGEVTGLKAGYVYITVEEENTKDTFDFGVTVLERNASNVKLFIASQNNANIFTRYDLLIGDGGNENDYHRDIYGSVNKILFNDPYKVDTSYESAAMSDTHHGGVKTSTEFITVH